MAILQGGTNIAQLMSVMMQQQQQQQQQQQFAQQLALQQSQARTPLQQAMDVVATGSNALGTLAGVGTTIAGIVQRDKQMKQEQDQADKANAHADATLKQQTQYQTAQTGLQRKQLTDAEMAQRVAMLNSSLTPITTGADGKTASHSNFVVEGLLAPQHLLDAAELHQITSSGSNADTGATISRDEFLVKLTQATPALTPFVANLKATFPDKLNKYQSEILAGTANSLQTDPEVLNTLIEKTRGIQITPEDSTLLPASPKAGSKAGDALSNSGMPTINGVAGQSFGQAISGDRGEVDVTIGKLGTINLNVGKNTDINLATPTQPIAQDQSSIPITVNGKTSTYDPVAYESAITHQAEGKTLTDTEKETRNLVKSMKFSIVIHPDAAITLSNGSQVSFGDIQKSLNVPVSKILSDYKNYSGVTESAQEVLSNPQSSEMAKRKAQADIDRVAGETKIWLPYQEQLKRLEQQKLSNQSQYATLSYEREKLAAEIKEKAIAHAMTMTKQMSEDQIAAMKVQSSAWDTAKTAQGVLATVYAQWVAERPGFKLDPWGEFTKGDGKSLYAASTAAAKAAEYPVVIKSSEAANALASSIIKAGNDAMGVATTKTPVAPNTTISPPTREAMLSTNKSFQQRQVDAFKKAKGL